MEAEQVCLWTAVVPLVIALDLWLLRWLRGYFRQRGIGNGQSGQEVRAFGAFSPVLTWLKYRRLPEIQKPPPQPLPAAIAPDDSVGVSSSSVGSPVQSESAPVSSPSPGPATPISSESKKLASHVSSVRLLFEAAEGTAVHVTVEVLPGPTTSASRPGASLGARLARGKAQVAARLSHLRTVWKSRPLASEQVLFGLALLVYAVTLLWALEHFPIYFFSDEAVQTVLAADFLRDNFFNYDGEFLPTYFKNDRFYSLSATVYLQTLSYVLFGKSVFVTRATAVLATVPGAIAVGLMLRDIFKIRYWWSGVLLLSATPAWFLHSRTAFETAQMASFYACFLYAYLLYRFRAPRYLYPALVLGALTFYTYSPGQMVMLVTGALLLLSDWRYHWQNRAVGWRGLALLAVLALPYVRFYLTHPTAPFEQLSARGGDYWLDPLPLSEKLARFGSDYVYGLSPGYWYAPQNNRDLARHVMKGYGHILKTTLPFAVLGLVLTLKQIRSQAHRVLLIALLAAPAGGALAQIGVTRVLVFVIPATLLTALGVSAILAWLERLRLPRAALALGLFALLSAVNINMLRDALVNGPTWFSDYGLGGMQYGARQVFGAVQDYLRRLPDTRIILSPGWANNTDALTRFFLPDPLPLQLGSIEGHIVQRQPLTEDMLFVMTPAEYEKTLASGKFADIRVEQTLPYPDGRPGFYFVRLDYAENIDAILEAEREARRQLVEEEIVLNGQPVQVRYSPLDMGVIQNAFDGDPNSVMRTSEANPLVIELSFPQPRTLNSISVRLGSVATRLTVRLEVVGSSTPALYSHQVGHEPGYRDMTIDFDAPLLVERLRVEVESVEEKEPTHVHLWEVRLR